MPGVCIGFGGVRLPAKSLEVDHVIPVSKGGTDAMSNLRSTCRPCNRHLGAKSGENVQGSSRDW